MKRAFPGYSLCPPAGAATAVLVMALWPGSAFPVDTPDHSKFTDKDCANCHVSEVINRRPLMSAMQSAHFDFLCTTCHDTHGSNNLRNIYEALETPTSGVRTVLFLNLFGPNSFADGDAVYDGVCEVCHTSTAYHRNNASGDHTHNAATNCSTCHDHYNGFQVTDCKACHNTNQPYLAGDYRRQVVENNGDGGGDFVSNSHHVSDGTSSEVVTTGDCAVCHDQSNHRSYTDGVSVYLNDPGGGAPIFYDGVADSLERFCSACHDGTHSSPFSDGRAAPELPPAWGTSPHKQAGATCFGEGSGGCHTNAHGSDEEVLLSNRYNLQSSVPYTPSSYELCWRCHNPSWIVFGVNKFDDLHERHVSRRDAPCAYCHNPHAPYDEGEGHISFEYGIEHGWDIQLIDSRDLSDAYWLSGDETQGFCYIQCHGKKHRGVDYDRSLSPPTGIGDTPEFSIEKLKVFPTPTTGPATFHIVTSGAGGGAPPVTAIYDVTGRLVRAFASDIRTAGERFIQWDGRDNSGRMVSSGVYLFRVDAGKSRRSQKFVILR